MKANVQLLFHAVALAGLGFLGFREALPYRDRPFEPMPSPVLGHYTWEGPGASVANFMESPALLLLGAVVLWTMALALIILVLGSLFVRE